MAVSALTFSTGCADGQSLSEKYPTQWTTCNALFGAKNMESLRDMLDSDDLKFSNPKLSVDQVKKSLAKEAIVPYDKRKGFDTYDVCTLSGNGTFDATVRWSADTLKAVQTYTDRWHRASADVYVSEASPIHLVFRCEIKGAASGPHVQVLLEVRTWESSTNLSTDFHQKLSVNLARTLRDELACTNKPNIPDDLQLSK
ncbi:hypothetical protein NFX46_05315 [Streptomyces phaeoluteigriseus]|uniref:DUF3558 domain-containing protein n=1 Tax=Streptomyces phaeoluteigriseus TaxID=114686 RepID=A0ABY4Z2Q2_9ACTN|nr:hypothetical protein [Streptomyces phaeoluteigriseus]USQ83251.1 hypothetical protein NFX46_05315 [Streptomyces phaeoluteigriseus]